ncbi:hypothetical protein Efla_003633 [Eimeria flavescens]
MLGARRIERLLVCGGWPLPAVKALDFRLRGEAASHKLDFAKGFLPGLRLENPSLKISLSEGAAHNTLSITYSREGPPVVLNLDLYAQPHQLMQRVLDLQALAHADE